MTLQPRVGCCMLLLWAHLKTCSEFLLGSAFQELGNVISLGETCKEFFLSDVVNSGPYRDA